MEIKFSVMAIFILKREEVRMLKIKKVDDKPMVIHTKEKAKIHTVQSKELSIKGRNVLSRENVPKIKGATVNASSLKESQKYRKATKHQAGKDETCANRNANQKQGIKKAKDSIKKKDSNLKYVGLAGAKTATDQMEGGEELQQSAMVAYGLAKPITETVSKTSEAMKQAMLAERKRKLKVVEPGKKTASKTAKATVKKTTKKVAKDTGKKVAKDTAKGVAKKVAKDTTKAVAKTATTTATTAAGTAISPGVGTAIGLAAGYVAGVAVEQKDMQITNRNRKIKFFLDKINAQDKQTDSLAKLVKDLLVKRAMTAIKAAAPIIGIVFLAMALIIAIAAIPVVAVVGILYNSPFAIFLPPLESGDTVMSVTSAYVADFNRDVSTLASEHTGYDYGDIIYVGYEGSSSSPSNYYDIMCIYMVKHGVGDTATVMNDTSKGWLADVVDDMCSYYTTSSTHTYYTYNTYTNEDGEEVTEEIEHTETTLHVNVELKDYRDMITEYSFNDDQIELIEQMMSPQNLAMLSGYGGGSSQSSLTQDEINDILSGISGTQRTVCSFVLSKVGYPYSQDYRDSGSYYDCSSLAYYAWQSAGVNISFGGSNTAAAEAQGLNEAGRTVAYADMQPGDLIFYSYCNNGRYMNISHVAIYVGNGKVVEAKSEAYGVVYGDVPNVGSIVLIGRPQ